MPTTLLDVVCPEGAGEGQLVTVAHGGQSFDVTVPPGLSAGDEFKVEVEVVDAEPEADPEPSMSDFDELANANDIISLSDDDDDGAWYYGGGDPSAGSAARAVVSAAVQASRLKPHEAASLRRIMKAVNTFTALDDIVREHAPAFSDYSPDGEQRLEWTSIHRQFVDLVEARVSFELDQLNADNVRGLARPVRAGGARQPCRPVAVCCSRVWCARVAGRPRRAARLGLGAGRACRRVPCAAALAERLLVLLRANESRRRRVERVGGGRVVRSLPSILSAKKERATPSVGGLSPLAPFSLPVEAPSSSNG